MRLDAWQGCVRIFQIIFWLDWFAFLFKHEQAAVGRCLRVSHRIAQLTCFDPTCDFVIAFSGI
jgi:hypothetical protein